MQLRCDRRPRISRPKIRPRPFYGHRLRPHRKHRHSLPKRRTGKFQNICLHVFGHLPVRRFALSAHICQEFLGAGIVMGNGSFVGFPAEEPTSADTEVAGPGAKLFRQSPLRHIFGRLPFCRPLNLVRNPFRGPQKTNPTKFFLM